MRDKLLQIKTFFSYMYLYHNLRMRNAVVYMCRCSALETPLAARARLSSRRAWFCFTFVPEFEGISWPAATSAGSTIPHGVTMMLDVNYLCTPSCTALIEFPISISAQLIPTRWMWELTDHKMCMFGLTPDPSKNLLLPLFVVCLPRIWRRASASCWGEMPIPEWH